MNTPAGNPGAVSATGPIVPGEISSGQATQPGDVGKIMQNMFSQMVNPGEVTPPLIPPVITVQPPAVNPVILKEPVKEPVKIEAKGPDTNFFAEEPVDTPPEAPVDEEPDMSDIPDDPNSGNWKKAREALKTERKSIKALTKDFNATKSKLDKYEKGEIVPEIITAKDNRISQLEKYETIVNGKLSDEYQTLVAMPAGEKKSTLNKIADDYQVPENIREQLLQKIVETENEKERNALITRYFPDAIGATKVETLVKELHQLGQTALDMEKKPAETMQTLQTQYQSKKQKESEIIASQFESVSKVSWNKALEKTANEGLFPELILDPTNSEISKIAEKNQHRAGIQYGALVKKLHQNGLKTLPEDLATGLARAIQLSIGSVGVARRLEEAEAELAELKGTNGMIATYFRPGTNNNGNGRPPPPVNDKGPTSPQEAGKMATQVFKK